MDAEIIAAIKRRYRAKQYERALDNIDENSDNIYDIDLLTVMRWISSIWEELPADIIANCYRHTRVLGNRLEVNDVDTLGVDAVQQADEELLRSTILDLAPHTGISIADLLNAEERMPTFATISEGNMVADIISDATETSESSEDDEPAIVAHSLPSVRAQLHALSVVKRIIDSEVIRVADRHVVNSAIRTIQREVRKQRSESAVQTTIDEFFR